MSFNFDEISHSMSKKLSPFESGREGLIIKGAKDTMAFGEQILISACLIAIEPIAESYRQYLEREMKDPNDPRAFNRCFPVLDRFKRALKEVKSRDRKGRFIRSHGFYAVEPSVYGYVPFFDSRELRTAPSHMTLSLFFQRYYGMGDVKPIELGMPFERIIPFTKTCRANISRITAAFDELLIIFFDEQVHSEVSLPLPYGVKVEIHENTALDRVKTAIECMMKAKLGGRESEIEYKDALSCESSFNVGSQTTILFHVTVLGDDAYLGFFMDPEKMNYCRFGHDS